MSIGVKTLVQCTNANIACASVCSPIEVLQLSSVSKDFEAGHVYSVACCASLPSAACNKGRFIFLSDLNKYVFSDGTSWTNDFTTVGTCYAWAWGNNSAGRLGDNSTTSKSSPVSVVGGFTDWCQVSAGEIHSLGVRCNGTAWAWGTNTGGVLGDNSGSAKSSPVSVVGGFTNWCQVSAGIGHSLGVRSNGTAWAWGCNSIGQLGDNTTTNRSSPVSIIGGFTDWCQVSAQCHSLGVRCNGTAWAWGQGTSGKLGDNSTIDKSSPVSVVGGFTDWCQVSAGTQHSLGLRTNGTAWAWGQGSYGKLGNNCTTDRSSPVSVVGGFTDWCQVSAGRYHSTGIRTNGTLWTWGNGNNGRLADGTTTHRCSPVSVIGGFTDWCQVSISFAHTLAVRTNGTLWGWGYNAPGTLADGTTTARSSPVSAIGGFNDWYEVSAGSRHSLGIRRAWYP